MLLLESKISKRWKSLWHSDESPAPCDRKAESAEDRQELQRQLRQYDKTGVWHANAV